MSRSPQLPGFLWRPLSVEDVAGLAELAAVCAPLDGNRHPATQPFYAARLAGAGPALATNTLCAAAVDGDSLAAFAWVTFDGTFGHEFRVYLDGRVRPEFRGRGLGRFLLAWSEARSRAVPPIQANGRPIISRIDTYDEHNPSAGPLFVRCGFRLALAEEDMRRDLSQPFPPVALPAGYSIVTWAPEFAGQFYVTYADAFRARLGARTTPSQAQWQSHYTTFPTFRPENRSLVGRTP